MKTSLLGRDPGKFCAALAIFGSPTTCRSGKGIGSCEDGALLIISIIQTAAVEVGSHNLAGLRQMERRACRR